MELETIITIFIKVLKLVLDFIIMMLYRYGGNSGFLGVGGTWNLNEVKNPDVEIVASGVFVGYFIYTSVILIAFCFGTTKHKASVVDFIMNITGIIMFIGVGGIALHYWCGYQNANHAQSISTMKQVGIALGSLCVVEGAVFLLDTVLAFLHLYKKRSGEW
ncbi:hypothetical protein GE061_004951 [Apolygus lucorum]|uniref:MARVEL domain-containing protein n=1 Tax=Apolygus lucorum TaxID=248454 RepID=A0A6A4IZR7_APOLU|nr:hypothetical protein GE061_004951 [Apolygus lucorum]